MKITKINDFRPFWAPLGAPENFYTFYSPLASFSFIFRASWISKIWFIFLQKNNRRFESNFKKKIKKKNGRDASRPIFKKNQKLQKKSALRAEFQKKRTPKRFFVVEYFH